MRKLFALGCCSVRLSTTASKKDKHFFWFVCKDVPNDRLSPGSWANTPISAHFADFGLDILVHPVVRVRSLKVWLG